MLQNLDVKSLGTADLIYLTELKQGMGCVAVKFVPRLMTDDQKQHGIELCEGLLQRAKR